jgi:hypothetical protein
MSQPQLKPKSHSKSPSKSPTKTSDVVYFTYGRFQPPTNGHGSLINDIVRLATENNADHYIFPSMKSNDQKIIDSGFKKRDKDGNILRTNLTLSEKNQWPLKLEDRVKYMSKMFPHANIYKDREQDTKKNANASLFNVVNFLWYKKNYKKMIMIVGEDTVNEYKKTFAKYNGNYDLEIISGGNRTISKEGKIEGMSGTKMRVAAVYGEGDVEAFTKGITTENGEMTPQDIGDLMEKIRVGLGLPAKSNSQRKNQNNNQTAGGPVPITVEVITRKTRILEDDERMP